VSIGSRDRAIDVGVIAAVLSRPLDDLAPRLTHNGYDPGASSSISTRNPLRFANCYVAISIQRTRELMDERARRHCQSVNKQPWRTLTNSYASIS